MSEKSELRIHGRFCTVRSKSRLPIGAGKVPLYKMLIRATNAAGHEQKKESAFQDDRLAAFSEDRPFENFLVEPFIINSEEILMFCVNSSGATIFRINILAAVFPNSRVFWWMEVNGIGRNLSIVKTAEYSPLKRREKDIPLKRKRAAGISSAKRVLRKRVADNILRRIDL